MKNLETTTMNFGIEQTESIRRGSLHRQRLVDIVSNISISDNSRKYKHTYLFSLPGLGKTYTVTQYLEESRTDFVKVSGNVSMFAFGIQLAIINYLNPERKPLIVFVDDCDEIFRTQENCNTMKNVLDGAKKYTYEKSLASQWQNFSEIQKEAITHFQGEGKLGFEVPTDNMTFVLASNFKLPVDDDVYDARIKGLNKSVLLSHRNAIRSRCRVADFDLSQKEHWGWIADVILNTNCLDRYRTSNSDKRVILDFIWYNWNKLTERSVRLVEKMVEIMNDYPESYNVMWEIDFLKN